MLVTKNLTVVWKNVLLPINILKNFCPPKKIHKKNKHKTGNDIIQRPSAGPLDCVSVRFQIIRIFFDQGGMKNLNDIYELMYYDICKILFTNNIYLKNI